MVKNLFKELVKFRFFLIYIRIFTLRKFLLKALKEALMSFLCRLFISGHLGFSFHLPICAEI